jgi:hypothetical protein
MCTHACSIKGAGDEHHAVRSLLARQLHLVLTMPFTSSTSLLATEELQGKVMK